MKISTLTKSEIRQCFNDHEVFLWFRETMNKQFNHEANLIGAPNAERLWQIKGHAEVLKFMNDIDRLLEFIDLEDE